MAFPPYKSPPAIESPLVANELYGETISVPRVVELIEVDPDQDYTVVVSLAKKNPEG